MNSEPIELSVAYKEPENLRSQHGAVAEQIMIGYFFCFLFFIYLFFSNNYLNLLVVVWLPLGTKNNWSGLANETTWLSLVNEKYFCMFRKTSCFFGVKK